MADNDHRLVADFFAAIDEQVARWLAGRTQMGAAIPELEQTGAHTGLAGSTSGVARCLAVAATPDLLGRTRDTTPGRNPGPVKNTA